jgi:hypothetical protein
MENMAIFLIVVALLILAIILGLLTYLIFRMMRQNPTFTHSPIPPTGEGPHPDISKAEFHPAIIERLKEAEKLKPKRADLFCPNHSEEPGEAACAICDLLFCKACIKPFKTMHFCKEHIPLIMRNEWEEVIKIKTSTHDPEQGVRLYDFKKKLFHIKNLPTFIETHYKINVDQDYIETYLVMFAIKEDSEKVSKAIQEEYN